MSKGEVTRSGNTFLTIFFCSALHDLTDVELYCEKHYVHVQEEGPPNLFFDVLDSQPGSPAGDVSVNGCLGNNVPGTPIPEDTFIRTGDTAEDIVAVLAQGLAVDDGNAPAPENVPTATTHQSTDPMTGLFHGQTFHWSGVCQR